MDKKLSIKMLEKDYEAPFAEIVKVDLVAIMKWSGINQTFDQESTAAASSRADDDA